MLKLIIYSVVAAYKFGVSFTDLVPDLVLYKEIVTLTVHSYGRTAYGHFGISSSDFHIILKLCHFADRGFVIVGFVVASFTALPQSVISPRIEKPLFIKARFVGFCFSNPRFK